MEHPVDKKVISWFMWRTPHVQFRNTVSTVIQGPLCQRTAWASDSPGAGDASHLFISIVMPNTLAVGQQDLHRRRYDAMNYQHR